MDMCYKNDPESDVFHNISSYTNASMSNVILFWLCRIQMQELTKSVSNVATADDLNKVAELHNVSVSLLQQMTLTRLLSSSIH